MMGPPPTVQGGVSAPASGPRIAAAVSTRDLSFRAKSLQPESLLFGACTRRSDEFYRTLHCSAACPRRPRDCGLQTAHSRRLVAHQAALLQTPAECMTAPVLRNAMRCAGSVLSQASLATLSCYPDGFTHHLLIQACRRREPPALQPALQMWSWPRGNTCMRADRDLRPLPVLPAYLHVPSHALSRVRV